MNLHNFDFGSDVNGQISEINLLKEMTEGKYELERRVQSGDIVLDIGANCGTFPFTIQQRNPSKVVCVEPSDKLHIILRKNLAKMPFDSVVHHYGIGTDKTNVYGNSNNKCKNISFKDLIKTANLDYVDFLKIDCEGGEWSIFTEENYEFLTQNVGHLSAELHISNIDNGVEKLIEFKNRYLVGTSNYRVFEPYIWKDATDNILSDEWIRAYYDWWNPIEGGSAQLLFYMGKSCQA